MSKSPPKTVHVAFGRVAGAALEEIMETAVVVVDDDVLLGPSSADSSRHRALRARYFGASPSTALEEELARSPGSALCVNVPPTPCGLLSLCRICSLALESDSRVSVVDLCPTCVETPTPGRDLPRSAFHAGADILRDRPPATPWSRLQVAFAATLWRLWCRRSPVAFSRFIASGHELHPQIASLGLYHAGVFPRQGDRGLLPSRFDELVLRQLSQDWVTPARIYVQSWTDAPELSAWLSHTGDSSIGERLLAWSRHTRGRIVERQRARKSQNLMIDSSFRWHPGGSAILDALPTLDAAPPVEIGGAVAYDPDRPWVCRVDATAWPYVSRGRHLLVDELLVPGKSA
jgi:hypothetical protein